MRPHAIRFWPGYLAALLLLIAPPSPAMDAARPSVAALDAMAQAASPQAIAEYRRKLGEYQEARAAFEQEAGAYWNSIADKRRGRNAKRRDHQPITLDDYVLTPPAGLFRAEAAGESTAVAARAGRTPRAQIYSCCRRSLKSRCRAFPVRAA